MSRIRGAILSLALLLSLDAVAHTQLSKSVPADGDEIASPAEIVLEFSEAVHVTAVSLTSNDSDLATGEIPDGPSTEFAIPLEGPLEPGEYAVSWRAVGADTHIVSGDFRFVVIDERQVETAASGDGSDSEPH